MQHLSKPFVTFSLGTILLGIAFKDWTVPVGLIGFALIGLAIGRPFIRWINVD